MSHGTFTLVEDTSKNLSYNTDIVLIDGSDKFLTHILRVCSGYLKITHDYASGFGSFVVRAYSQFPRCQIFTSLILIFLSTIG